MEKIEKISPAEQKNVVFENAQNYLQKEAAQEFGSNKVINKYEPAGSKLPDLKLEGRSAGGDIDFRPINKMTPEQAKSPTTDKNLNTNKSLTIEKPLTIDKTPGKEKSLTIERSLTPTIDKSLTVDKVPTKEKYTVSKEPSKLKDPVFVPYPMM